VTVHLLLTQTAAQSLSTSSIEGTLLSLGSVVVLLAAFACLGSKLFNRYVAYYGFQSVVLSLTVAVVAYHFDNGALWALAALTLVLKGVAIPLATRHLLLQRLGLKRDTALSIGLSTSLIAGALLTAFAYLVIQPKDFPHRVVASSVIPLATAVILLGALIMVVRRHTVAQLIGWLITENGVVLGAITLVATFPFIVEAGIFLDIVAAVLIMVAFVSGITRHVPGATASELQGLAG
jgi:hydrogenase-4 component E